MSPSTEDKRPGQNLNPPSSSKRIKTLQEDEDVDMHGACDIKGTVVRGRDNHPRLRRKPLLRSQRISGRTFQRLQRPLSPFWIFRVVSGQQRSMPSPVASVYKAVSVRKDVIGYLTKLYPTKREDFISLPASSSPANSAESIIAVQIARSNDLPYILPAALYRCCELSMHDLLYGSKYVGCTAKLSTEDWQKCLSARDCLINYKLNLVHRFIGDMRLSDKCLGRKACTGQLMNLTRSQRRMLERDSVDGGRPSGIFGAPTVYDRFGEKVCEACQLAWKGAEDHGRGSVWELLPNTLFGLPKWSELRERMVADLADVE